MKISRKTKQYTQASDGEHSAILADIIDRGLMSTVFGDKEKAQFIYLIDELDGEGKPIQVSDFTISLHKDSKLISRVRVLDPKLARGAVQTGELDTEALIGPHALLTTEQSVNTKGQTYANIIAMVPLPSVTPKVSIPLSFKRQLARPTPAKTNATRQLKNKAKTNGGTDAPNIPGLFDVSDEDPEIPGDPRCS